MIYNEREETKAQALAVARQMMTAARTAPKGKGIDIIEILTYTGDNILKLAEMMREESERTSMKFFLRDADNIEKADAVVIIGTTTEPLGLNCGFCGAASCADMAKMGLGSCAINQTDLGIALGSAVATAADLRVDTRIMFSVGYTAINKGMLPGCKSAYAIPISIKSKNPFFDRK